MTDNYPEFSQIKGATQSDVTIEGNLKADNAVRMSISAEGTAHIMSLLTDLYSDPNLAVLREYSSNAYDSHKEAGQTRPIEISLPSRFEPSFIVQDFGIGMSAETIRTIYSSYGASTKRNDFTQVGAFGLGCKAALTLTQQFTLNSVKDGIRTMALIFRSDDGVGTVNILSETPTDDPNGVTVTIPISDSYQFNRNVNQFFFSWPSGSVLVDGKAPTSLYDQNYYVIDQGHTRIGLKTDRIGYTVVMGGISYDLRFSELGVSDYRTGTPLEALAFASRRNLHIVSEVPIGSIDLTPSREDVRYSDRTTKFLKALVEQVANEVPKFIQKQIEDAPTRREVLIQLNEWAGLEGIYSPGNSTGNLTNVDWNGEKIPKAIEMENERVIWNRAGWKSKRMFQSSKSTTTSATVSMSLPAITHYYINVSALDDSKIAKVNREVPFFFENLVNTSDEFRTEHDLPRDTRVFMVKDAPTSKWITDNEMFVEVKPDTIFEAAKEIRKKARAQARANTPEVMYTVYSLVDNGDSVYLSAEQVGHLSMKKKWYYIEGLTSGKFDSLFNHNLGNRGNIALATFLKEMGLKPDKDKIVYVEKTRKYDALVKRAGHGFKPLYTEIVKYSDTLLANASKEEKVFAHLMSYGHQRSTILANIRNFQKLRPLLPDTNDLALIMDESDKAVDFSAKYDRLTSMFAAPDLGSDVEDVLKNLKAVADKYLLLSLNDYSAYPQSNVPDEHYAMYINMVDGKDDK